ncbi:lysylphosphatidylglycerol synthase transmembrane domain-containing protein [Denitrobaculum tricleocarpae]|uniref:Flippase-like domain-containing protein n=1 Tax=Denitrobaculum tricleocarpae TaxID=2591009 RepID=A0A545U1I6_9PROT|nr:lysylphosphatidylglycerol synthase transmembrane domain-containing protein [Denitrobaculum tricleocarpae]TQV83341.1 flippase-like domain-containing protein [Denitrobaculum tricleocarpae]
MIIRTSAGHTCCLNRFNDEARSGHVFNGLVNKKSWYLLLFGLVVGGAAAWLVFGNTDVAGVFDILQHDTDMTLTLVAATTYGLFFLGKALRWRYLLEPVLEISSLRLLPYVLIGYAGNVLLPFQAGEAGRGYLLSKHHEIGTAAALSGIALEKLLDFFALLLLLIWALIAMDAPSPLAEQLGLSLAGILTFAALCLIALLLEPKATAGIIDRALSCGPQNVASWLAPKLHDAIRGLMALRQTSLILKLVVTSLATWMLMLITLYLTINAVQLEVPLAVAILVLVLAAVGLALPTSPGFIGTLQAAFVLGMVPFGTEQEGAVAASLLYQFLTTLPPLALGLICLAFLKRGF